jgi:hypothetical protein
MCVILYLTPGQMPDQEKLYNAVWNNWHSYGLVTMVDGKLDVKKKVPKKEVDPVEVWNLLKEDRGYPRFLHLRHNTAGATTPENCHPFDVFFDQKSGRHRLFMHNGTLYDYKSKKTNSNGGVVDDDSGPSDTKNFVDRVLIPYLSGTNFGDGHGDVKSKLVQNLVMKFWSTNNRGVIIANDQPSFFLGDWKKIKIGEGKDDEIVCSNDDYFDTLKRGPEFDRRRLQAEEAAKAKPKGTTVPSVRSVEKLSDYRNGTHGFYSLSTSLANIVNDFELYDRVHAVSLGYATRQELEELYDQKNDCLYVMDWVFTDYANLFKEYEVLQEKHEAATKIIATLKTEQRAVG